MKCISERIFILLAVSIFSLPLFICATATSRNIIDLGADPSGKKDSWAAIQKSLDAGGTVVLPNGTYLLSKTLHITQSDTTLIGSAGTCLLFPEGFKESGLKAKGDPFTLKNIVIRDITVESDKANYTPGKDGKYACGITLYGVDGGSVENCSVKWFTFTGIYIAASKNIRVSACSTLGGRHGISANGHIGNPAKNNAPYGCSYVSITDCRIRETWDTFIPIGLCASYVTISGCQCEGSAAHGIDIFNSSHVTATGNNLRNWMDPDVFAHGATQAVGIFIHSDWGVSLEIPTDDIVVRDNILVCDKKHPEVRPVGINIAGGVDGVLVAKNIVSGGRTALAITDVVGKSKLFAPQNVSVTDNVFKDQQSVMWIESRIPMSAVLSDNTWSPLSDGTVAHLGAKTKGVKLINNKLTRGRLPEIPDGITVVSEGSGR